MKTAGLIKRVAALALLALCAACSALPLSLSKGQGEMSAPSGAGLNSHYVGRTLWVNGRPVTAARMNPNPPLRYATIVPDRRRSRKKFEYVISFYGSYASIFDYPKSDAQIGSINNVGGQGCTNVLDGYGKNIFWIVAAYNAINEYKVPQTPIKTLSVSYSSLGQPSSCAMNASGDLAVGILNGTASGDVVIFKNATGTPTVYTTPLSREYFDGYDPQGNLFADGTNDSFDFKLVELPKGSSKFQTITTSNSVSFPGSVQWDGSYLTVFDQNTSNFYQYTVSGTKATLKNTISISAGDCAQTWIVKGLVYCGDYFNNDGAVYKYPAGGSPIATLTGTFNSPLGVTVSERR